MIYNVRIACNVNGVLLHPVHTCPEKYLNPRLIYRSPLRQYRRQDKHFIK